MYWGWIVCSFFLLIFTLSAGIAFSFNEIIIPLNKDINSSMSLLDLLGSLPSSLPMLLAPLATFLYYKIGTRKTVVIGVFISTFSLAITALLKHITTMIIIYGFIGGLGLTLIVNPPFFLLDEYFPYNHPRHVLATSVIACAFPLATLLFNPITYALLSKLGWRMTYSVFAITMFIVGSVSSMTFRKPEVCDENISCKKETAEYDEIELSNVAIKKRTKIVHNIIWLIASLCKGMGYYTPFLTMVKQMETLGIVQSKATVAMVVIGVSELISRLITSYIGDYIKGKILFVYVIFCIALGVQNALATMATTYTHLLLYAVGLGIFGGPIIAAMYSSCSEVLQGQYVHEIFTTFRVGVGIGSMVGPLSAGYIYDKTNHFHLVYLVSSIAYFTAAVMYISIQLLNKYQPKCVFPEEESDKIPICMESNLQTTYTSNEP